MTCRRVNILVDVGKGAWGYFMHTVGTKGLIDSIWKDIASESLYWLQTLRSPEWTDGKKRRKEGTRGFVWWMWNGFASWKRPWGRSLVVHLLSPLSWRCCCRVRFVLKRIEEDFTVARQQTDCICHRTHNVNPIDICICVPKCASQQLFVCLSFCFVYL